MKLDDLDKSLLLILQQAGKTTTQELAESVNSSVSPCWRRIKRLEDAGVIKKYVAVLNPKKLGLHAMAFVHVSLIDHSEETVAKFDRFVQAEDQVVDCCSITGANDFVLKVVAADPEDLEEFIMKKILRMGLVRSSTTNFVLRNTKASTRLPLSRA